MYCSRWSVILHLQQAVTGDARCSITPRERAASRWWNGCCGSEQGPPIARALVGAGADVNARCGVTRATALHMAARRGHVEIARVLLERGAEIDARDYKGCTP